MQTEPLIDHNITHITEILKQENDIAKYIDINQLGNIEIRRPREIKCDNLKIPNAWLSENFILDNLFELPIKFPHTDGDFVYILSSHLTNVYIRPTDDHSFEILEMYGEPLTIGTEYRLILPNH